MNLDDRGAEVFDLAYDAASRLVSLEKNGAPEAAYAYDAFGRRVFKDIVAAPGATDYHYDPDGRLLAESANTGVPEREYIWLPLDFAGGDTAWVWPLAVVTDAGTPGPRLHYLHADHLGTPVAMTSGNLAQLEWSAIYRPFGELQSTTGTESLSLRFPGQLFDLETGFHQNWHRDYDPTLGRYLQSDPIGLAGGPNTYAYVGGDPVNSIDPTGEFGIVGAILGGGSDLGWQLLIEGKSFQCVEWGDVAIGAALGAVGGTGAKWFNLGKDLKLGKNLRVAPFGNRPNPNAASRPANQKYPHYHRRGATGPDGQLLPGQGIGRHRPWDSSRHDVHRGIGSDESSNYC